jgi:hypothetical protein
MALRAKAWKLARHGRVELPVGFGVLFVSLLAATEIQKHHQFIPFAMSGGSLAFVIGFVISSNEPRLVVRDRDPLRGG